MSLHYKTRGDSDPKGKPRVYFCCHPQDQAQYLQTVCNELLQISNCAVFWYDTAPDAQWELELGQMQLFVMPVTKRLLTDANRALNVEFRFAVENHIPVLPLMQEAGLEALFNQKCGDLQFLDKNDSDPTAISYTEKLKKYLEAVLIGDEMAEKIRKAFDAYIFLSYRKKDRKHAQELMRLIHKNPFCRDLAIWYDEFLTPGENFNASIQEALERSELFALAVTPNLVNEQNYVMTTEFPMARDAEKTILPAVLVQTDEKALKQKYPGIPDCTDAHDEKAMKDALLQAVQGLNVRQNDSDPVHNYHIGLAYLGGVDVEVDHKKALQLITEAAEAGLIDAMERLVTMYRDGVGVTRESKAETNWLGRIVSQASKNYKASGDYHDGWTMYHAAFRLGAAYERVGLMQNAKTAYQMSRQICEDLMDTFNYETLAGNYTITYFRLASVCDQLGEREDAQRYCGYAVELGEAMVQDAARPEWTYTLAAAYSKMCGYCMEAGHQSEAERYQAKSMAVREKLLQQEPSPKAQRAYSVGLIEAGLACQRAEKLQEAKQRFQQAYSIRQTLDAQLDTVQSKRDLAVSCERLGDIYVAENDLQQAMQYYQKLYNLRNQLYNDQGTAEDQRALSVCCNKYGDLCRKLQNPDGAKLCYQMSLTLAEILIYTSDAVTLREDLVQSLHRYIEILYECGTAAEVAAFYSETLSRYERIVQDETLTHILLSLTAGMEKMGKLAKQNKDLQQAKACYALRLQTAEKLTQLDNSLENRRLAAVAGQNMGSICKDLGLTEEAAEHYYRAVDVAVALAEEDDSPKNREVLGVICYKAGFVTRERLHFQGAYEIFSELARQFPEDASYAEKLKKAEQVWAKVADTADAPSEQPEIKKPLQSPQPEVEKPLQQPQKQAEKKPLTEDDKLFLDARQRAQKGEPEGLRRLAICYESGIGTQQDEAKAWELYLQSAQKGNAGAQLKMAKKYAKEAKKADALYWIRKAVRSRNYFAYGTLARWYRRGIVVKKNPLKALYWGFRKVVREFIADRKGWQW